MATDIVLLTLPGLEVRTPLTAPALLKATVEREGFTAKCIDWNVEFWNKVDDAGKQNWNEASMALEQETLLDKFWKDYLLPLATIELPRLRSLNPRWLGINIFIHKQRKLAVYFFKFFKKHLPNTKIIIGGAGSIDDDATRKWLNTYHLIDAYILSEGEKPLIEILKGNLDYPGINGKPPVQLDDIRFVPCPDYRDYDFSLYTGLANTPGDGADFVYVSGSRGCVRKCSFCDIEHYWPKYRYRTGEDIAEEILTLYQRHNTIKGFEFTDSLMNGSIKQLSSFCKTVIEYKEQGLIPKNFTWRGQAIVRPMRQMPEEYWKMMADSGCASLFLGVESGSEAVRNHMKKYFSNEDLDFAMKMAKKYNIRVVLLMIVGYPTETEQDFQDTLDFFTRHVDMKNQLNVQLGRTLGMSEYMPLWDKQEELGIEWYKDEYDLEQWRIGNFDKKERLKRWIRAYEHIKSLDIPTNIHNFLHFKNELEGLGITGFPSMGPSAT